MQQKISTIYMWDERNRIDVTISRHGKWGYSEHAYTDVTKSSQSRLLKATPPKPTKIQGNMVKWEF